MSKECKKYETKKRNTINRAKLIHAAAMELYEPENQSKSMKNIWRTQIQKKFPMCYRTFLNYIHLAEKNGCKRKR